MWTAYTGTSLILEKLFSRSSFSDIACFSILASGFSMKRHLNKSRLHFKVYVKSLFVKNLWNVLKNFNCWSIWDNRDQVKCSPPLIEPEINPLSDLASIKLQQKENYKNFIIGLLNINSIRNNFEMIAELSKIFIFF